jgi:hypothetical protein
MEFAGAGFVYAKAGLHELARDVLARLDEQGRRRYVAPFYSAAVQAGLGDTDEALRLLEQAVAERNWNIAWLHLDLFWDNMRSDLRFQRLQTETLDLSPFV